MATCRALICALDGLLLAVDARAVARIVAAVTVTPLPNGPAAVEGVVSVGGRIVPVFDLRRRLGLAARRPLPADRFVVVDTGRRRAILRFDDVREIADLEIDDLDRDSGLTIGDAVLDGAASTPDGVVFVHQADRFLSALEEAALERALATLDGAEATP